MGRRAGAPLLLLVLVLAATATAFPSSPATGTGRLMNSTNPPNDGTAVLAATATALPSAPATGTGRLMNSTNPPNDGTAVLAATTTALPSAPATGTGRLMNSTNPPNDDLAARRSSFTPEAYTVTWSGGRPSPDDLAAHRSSFTPEAYTVTWSGGRTSPDDLTLDVHVHRIHVEPGMLFLRKNLFPGAILPEGTKFAGDAAAPLPRSFASKATADAIPFDSKHLDTILRTFRIPRGSKKADQVAATLRTCEESSPEPHTCATSREAVAAFAAAALGTSSAPPCAVVTVVRGNEGATAAARYTVAPNGVARIGGKAVVPCHPMPYPYMVHYCHRPVGVEALSVELTAAADVSATAVAMCHANTANWDGRYFQMLNATRGEEICHFMPRGYVLWVAA